MKPPKADLGAGLCSSVETRARGYHIESRGRRFELQWHDGRGLYRIVGTASERWVLEPVIRKSSPPRLTPELRELLDLLTDPLGDGMRSGFDIEKLHLSQRSRRQLVRLLSGKP